MDNGTRSCVGFCTDVLVEILRRLPPNSRRRFRVVSRDWRDAVDKRTATDLRSRAKTLLVTSNGRFVLDDNARVKPVLVSQQDLPVVGTCNCLCDDSKPGGAIVLVNLAKGERLVIPPLPCADILIRGRLRWHEAYSFVHDQRTGRYKVVHVPCCFDRVWEFPTDHGAGVHAWGDVLAGRRDTGGRWRGHEVSPQGRHCERRRRDTYWVAESTKRIMSFDLEEECVTSVQPLPVPLPTRSGSSFHLVEVYGRLGVAIFHDSLKLAKTEVWVLESARGEQRWRRWYSVEVNLQPQWPGQWITLPHFAHGNHVLTHGNGILYRHEPNGTRKKSRYGMVQISERNTRRIAETGHVNQAFAYVDQGAVEYL